MPHHCSLLHNQNQDILSFLNLKKSLEQTEKYTKGFEHYYYIFRCPGLSNRWKFVLSNRLSGNFAPATELDINRFWPSPFGELVWNLSTQVNNGFLAAYITVSDPSRYKRRCFLPFMVYALVYTIIYSNLVNLATLSPRPESVYAHTCSPFSSKPLLRWPRTVETGLLINWQIALNIFGS